MTNTKHKCHLKQTVRQLKRQSNQSPYFEFGTKFKIWKMKSIQIIFFVCLCVLIVASTVSAENFFKELEGIGQRVRDAIISAGPAIDVINKATRIGKHDDDDD